MLQGTGPGKHKEEKQITHKERILYDSTHVKHLE